MLANTTSDQTNRLSACGLCGGRIPADERFCPPCEQQLAAACNADQVAMAALQSGTGPLETETLVPRLGERLVAQGYLDQRMLEFALGVQEQRQAQGEPVRLGQLLVELGLISREVVDRVAMQQLLQTQQALERSNQSLERRVQESTHQLKHALVKLSELSQLKADFVANVSHELRTPLAIMSGFAEMVANESLGPLNGEQTQALNSMMGANQRLAKLIEDLLQFSESTMGSVSLQLAAISLEQPVRRAVDRVWDLARTRQVTLVQDIPPGLPLVRADKQKVGWVIGEFLENAVKFSPAGGLVTLETAPQPQWVRVMVSDSGVGIPEHRIEEAFDPFHQLDGSMSRPQGGTGLGLALARRIIEAHGSEIEVHSRPGQGSRFAFTLPLAA